MMNWIPSQRTKAYDNHAYKAKMCIHEYIYWDQTLEHETNSEGVNFRNQGRCSQKEEPKRKVEIQSKKERSRERERKIERDPQEKRLSLVEEDVVNRACVRYEARRANES